MITMYDRAVMFAASAHAGQVRKYTGEPYIEHPKAVAALIRKIRPNDIELQAVAVLHDVVEDTTVTIGELREEFGGAVAYYVGQLTDPDVAGNRLHRKTQSRYQLSKADGRVQSVKLADMIDNTKSIKDHDPKFWKQYRIEKLMLLGALFHGDPDLWKIAYEQCVEGIL